MKSWRIIAIGCALSFLVPAAASPTEQKTTLRVATFALPPYVFPEGGRLTGFSIDLWNAVAERLPAKSQFEVVPDVDFLLGSVRNGKADVGVSGFFVNAERDRYVDFSVPILKRRASGHGATGQWTQRRYRRFD